jgi:spore coat protein U-like protein
MKPGIFLVFLMLGISAVQAQFLQFSVIVDTEVSASTVQELDFGTMLQNSEVIVGLDQNGSGWFQVAVLNVSDIQLFLDAPERLVLDSQFITCGDDPCSIGLDLGLAFYMDENPRIQGGLPMQPLSLGFNEITVSQAGTRSREAEYIYVNINVFGRLSIGEVPSGVYTGTLNLEVSY